MTEKQQRRIFSGRHILIRVLFIFTCSLAILSLIIFLYTVNHQNVSQFWTELISYGLSVLTPILSFLLGDIRAKDRAEINFADNIDEKIDSVISRIIEGFEKSNRGIPNASSSSRSDDSFGSQSKSYKSDTFLSDDKLNFLLDAGVINRRQYRYLLKKHSRQ